MEGILGPGDLNGDGFADIVCTAPLFKASYAAEGIAFAYFGSPTGPNQSPSWLTFGTTSGQKIGRSMASAGDVNGDGRIDLLVGGTGRVLVFHGRRRVWRPRQRRSCSDPRSATMAAACSASAT
ncbi:MAG: VCBS repeat-containing protein [Planctomycetes bacterium]|nr:VCBS repeat-containing protein [Planctomycetota bacterium]